MISDFITTSINNDIRVIIWNIDIIDDEIKYISRSMKQRGIISCGVNKKIDSIFLLSLISIDCISEFINHYKLRPNEILIVQDSITQNNFFPSNINVITMQQMKNAVNSKYLNDKQKNYSESDQKTLPPDEMKNYIHEIGNTETFDIGLKRLRLAANDHNEWALNELIDQLTNRGSNEDLKELFSLCKSNKDNNPELQLKLARMYRDGKGTKKNIDKAIESYRIAEFNNVAKSGHELIDILLKRGKEDDYNEALSLCIKYTKNDDSYAKGLLARMYRDGHGVKKDLDRAIDLMQEASSSKIGFAKNELIDLLLERGTPDDEIKAFHLASQYSKEGNAWSQARLARLYARGIGVEKNLDTAIELMTNAEAQGVIFARRELIDLKIERGKPEDLDVFIHDAENTNNPDYELIAKISMLYFKGTNVNQNLDKAIELMRIAHEGGIEWATNSLIDMLLKRGTPQDDKEAARIAFDYQTNEYTVARLARMYRDGIGVEKDLDKAISLMRESTNRGVNFASGELSHMLICRGRPEDLDEAFNLTFIDAMNGNKWSQGHLARMYRDGIGVEKDLDKAIDLMRMSSKSGVLWAKTELIDMLIDRGTKDDRKEIRLLMKN